MPKMRPFIVVFVYQGEVYLALPPYLYQLPLNVGVDV